MNFHAYHPCTLEAALTTGRATILFFYWIVSFLVNMLVRKSDWRHTYTRRTRDQHMHVQVCASVCNRKIASLFYFCSKQHTVRRLCCSPILVWLNPHPTTPPPHYQYPNRYVCDNDYELLCSVHRKNAAFLCRDVINVSSALNLIKMNFIRRFFLLSFSPRRS